jgi:hypothetical protein
MSIREIIHQAKKEQETFKSQVSLPVVDDGGENSLDHGRAYAAGDVAGILERHLRGDYTLTRAREILSDIATGVAEDSNINAYAKAKLEVYEQYVKILNEMKIKKYRNIDARNVVIPSKFYPQVERWIKADGWDTMPTTLSSEDILINPRMDEVKTDFLVLRKIAPAIKAGDKVSQIILEVEHEQVQGEAFKPKTWLHLVYTGGAVKEIETPAHQWEV